MLAMFYVRKAEPPMSARGERPGSAALLDTG